MRAISERGHMSQASSTISAIGGTDTDTNLNTSTSSRDFLLMCDGDNVSEAVSAMNFLPGNFKLTIVSDQNKAAHRYGAWMQESQLRDRVTFIGKETTSRSPFAFANAIIATERAQDDAEHTDAPHVVVSSSVDGMTSNGSNFTVQQGNTEALASALLSISRSAA